MPPARENARHAEHRRGARPRPGGRPARSRRPPCRSPTPSIACSAPTSWRPATCRRSRTRRWTASRCRPAPPGAGCRSSASRARAIPRASRSAPARRSGSPPAPCCPAGAEAVIMVERTREHPDGDRRARRRRGRGPERPRRPATTSPRGRGPRARGHAAGPRGARGGGQRRGARAWCAAGARAWRSSPPATSCRSPGIPLGPGQLHDSNARHDRPRSPGAPAPRDVRRAHARRRPARRRARRSARALERADVVVLTGGVSVGPARPRQARARRGRRRGGLLARRAAPGQADLVRHPRRRARLRPARATRSARWSPSCCSRGPRCWRSRAPSPTPGASAPSSTQAMPRTPGRDELRPRHARRVARDARPGRRAPTGSARCSARTGWRSCPPARASWPRARRSSSSCSERRPRRPGGHDVRVRMRPFAALGALLAAALAAVAGLRRAIAGSRTIGGAVLHTPTDDTAIDPRTGAVRSVQGADIIVPEGAVDGVWDPEHLERLARTYWRSLSRFTLGLVRVVYTEGERYVVLVHPPVAAAHLPGARVRDGRPRGRRALAHRARPARGRRGPRRRRLPGDRRPALRLRRLGQDPGPRRGRGRELLPRDRLAGSAAGSTSTRSRASTSSPASSSCARWSGADLDVSPIGRFAGPGSPDEARRPGARSASRPRRRPTRRRSGRSAARPLSRSARPCTRAACPGCGGRGCAAPSPSASA